MAKSKTLYLKIIGIILILVVIGLYISFNSRSLILGPQITVYEPTDGSVFDDPFIEIKGSAKNISFINLDDGPIYVNEEGFFNEKLLLSPGLSIIKVDAKDKFGREKTIFLKYTYNGTSTPMRESIDENVLEEDEDLPSEEEE